MKNKTFLILLFVSFWFCGFSQIKPVPKVNIDSLKTELKANQANIFKTNPLHYFIGPLLLFSEYRLMYERQANKNQSIEFGVSFLSKCPLFNESLDSSVTPTEILVYGYRAQIGYRFYLNKFLYQVGLSNKNKGVTGLYISPHASIIDVRVTTRAASRFNNYIRLQMLDVNLRTGIQFKVIENFYFDFFTGLGYKDNSFLLFNGNTSTPLDTEGLEYIFNSNLKINLGFNFGLRF